MKKHYFSLTEANSPHMGAELTPTMGQVCLPSKIFFNLFYRNVVTAIQMKLIVLCSNISEKWGCLLERFENYRQNRKRGRTRPASLLFMFVMT
jgi:hypothetical protein